MRASHLLSSQLRSRLVSQLRSRLRLRLRFRPSFRGLRPACLLGGAALLLLQPGLAQAANQPGLGRAAHETGPAPAANQPGPAQAAHQPGAPRHTPHHTPARPAAQPTGRLAPLTREEQAAQVLDRFTFGPRPGEVSAVARLGWESWFEQQLNPSSLDDTLLAKRLAQYPALELTPQQLAVQYPDGQLIRRIAEGKAAMPQDPQLAGVYEVLLARYRRKQAEEQAAGAATATP